MSRPFHRRRLEVRPCPGSGWRYQFGGTAPLVAPFREEPEQLQQRVQEVVAAQGGTLENLFFEVDRPVAYALVRDLDDFRAIRAVFRVLGVEQAVKVLDVEQATDAIGREQTIRGRFDTGSQRGQ